MRRQEREQLGRRPGPPAPWRRSSARPGPMVSPHSTTTPSGVSTAQADVPVAVPRRAAPSAPPAQARRRRRVSSSSGRQPSRPPTSGQWAPASRARARPPAHEDRRSAAGVVEVGVRRARRSRRRAAREPALPRGAEHGVVLQRQTGIDEDRRARRAAARCWGTSSCRRPAARARRRAVLDERLAASDAPARPPRRRPRR